MRLICGIDLFDTAAAATAFCLLITTYDRAHQLTLLVFCVIALLSTNKIFLIIFPSTGRHRFVHLREDTPVGSEVLRVRAHPRRHFSIQAIDGVKHNSKWK